ncbi:hypothetical protein J7K50_06120 [bacterium]|nr:hypothetical protein [bacterium]
MRTYLIGILAFCVMIMMVACPGGGGEEERTQPTTKPASPPIPSYETSKLATYGDFNLGMKGEEIKALFPEEGDYVFEEAFPPEGDPIMLSATPKEGIAGLSKGFGFFNGELVYIMEGGEMDEEAYNAKIAELKETYGEPTSDIPDFLKDTKFWSGEPAEEKAEGEGTEIPAVEGEDTEVTAMEVEEEGMGAEMPENALFWVDEANKLVLFCALEEGEAGIFLMRVDKIDEHFEALDKALNDMIAEMMSGLSEETGEADIDTTPAREGVEVAPVEDEDEDEEEVTE